jgi:hypothetical protein
VVQLTKRLKLAEEEFLLITLAVSILLVNAPRQACDSLERAVHHQT